jgi:hypothetical protein
MMERNTTSDGSLANALDELSDLLTREATALRALDANALSAIAEQKVQLESRLIALGPAQESDREALTQLRQRALENQILLVHARDTVRGLIATLGGGQPGVGAPGSSAMPVRLDVRG